MLSKAFTCNCGCGSTIVINVLDDSISVFFAKSRDHRAAEDFIDYVKGYKCLSGVLLTDEDFDELVKPFAAVLCTNEPVENYSHIKFNYDEDFGYSVELYNDDNILHFLRHPGYVYSIKINRDLQMELTNEIAAARAKKASHTTR